MEPIPPDREAHLGRWVEFTKPAHQLIAAARVPEAERLTATIKAHVQFQLDNLMTYPIVRDGVAAGTISVHGWIYDMEQGALSAYDSAVGRVARPARPALTARRGDGRLQRKVKCRAGRLQSRASILRRLASP